MLHTEVQKSCYPLCLSLGGHILFKGKRGRGEGGGMSLGMGIKSSRRGVLESFSGPTLWTTLSGSAVKHRGRANSRPAGKIFCNPIWQCHHLARIIAEFCPTSFTRSEKRTDTMGDDAKQGMREIFFWKYARRRETWHFESAHQIARCVSISGFVLIAVFIFNKLRRTAKNPN